MGRFGLWNPNIFHQSWDAENDANDDRPGREQGPTDSGRLIPEDRPPRTIGYGTTAHDNDGTNNDIHPLLVVDDAMDIMGDNNSKDDVPWEPSPIQQRRRMSGTSSSGGGDASTQQEIPSLTGAFRSLENRSIVLNCFLYLMIYMTIAVVAYSFVLEKWTIIDSLYFAVATFTTCGYGDKEPTTVAGKIFTIFFAIYGVIILGVFIAIFGAFISEAQTRAMKRFQRKHQNHMMDTMFRQSSRRPDLEETGFWKDHVSLADDIWKVLQAESPLIFLVGIMAMILGIREGWDWTSTLYFCIMAATTTGYGDYTPTNQIDKLYCVILLPLAVAVFGEILGRIANIYIQRKQRVAQTKFLHRSLTLCDIRNMDSDDDGRVDMSDFLSFMLIALQKVDRRTIDELKTIFRSLDTNGNGFLEEADLDELVHVNYLPTLDRIRKELNASSAEFDRKRLQKLSSSVISSTESPTKPKLHQRSHTVF